MTSFAKTFETPAAGEGYPMGMGRPAAGHSAGEQLRSLSLPALRWLLMITGAYRDLFTAIAAAAAGGISLLIEPRSSDVGLISNLLVASLLIGVARAWELVGHRKAGTVSSLAVLAGRAPVDRSLPPENSDPARTLVEATTTCSPSAAVRMVRPKPAA